MATLGRVLGKPAGPKSQRLLNKLPPITKLSFLVIMEEIIWENLS